MKDNKNDETFFACFPDDEKKQRAKLLSLMNDWKNEISRKQPIVFHDDMKKYETIDYFGIDGFFPLCVNIDVV
jgi:hypothetical protein